MTDAYRKFEGLPISSLYTEIERLTAENERLRVAVWPLTQVHEGSIGTIDLLLGEGTVERARMACQQSTKQEES